MLSTVGMLGGIALLARHEGSSRECDLGGWGCYLCPSSPRSISDKSRYYYFHCLICWCGWVCGKNGRGWLAASIATAAVIKIFPGVLLAYFLWRRDWKVIRAAVVWGMVLLLFQVITVGPALVIDYIDVLARLGQEGQSIDGEPIGVFQQYSVKAFADRLFTPAKDTTHITDSELLRNLTWLGIVAVLVVGSAWAIVKTRLATRYAPTSR